MPTVDHHIEDKIRKVDTDITGKKELINFNDLKSGGFIKQRQKDMFTVRCRVPGGRLPVRKLKKIAEVAEKYGAEYLHLSFRQSLEILYVNYKDFSNVKTELAEAGQEIASCGPRVRVPTACGGCEYNPNGLIDTQQLALMVDEKFFGTQCYHKFKISFSGCPIDCARTNEMDLGFQGAKFPHWLEEKCIGCTVCAKACTEGAIVSDDEGKPIFEPNKCLYCADCIRACPTNSWVEGNAGVIVRVGGKHGRHPLNASVVAKFLPVEKIPDVIIGTIEWYKKYGEGKGRIRIGDVLREAGIKSYMKDMKDVFGDKIVEDSSAPEIINIHPYQL